MLDNYRILCYNITMVDSTTRSYLGDLAQLVEHLLCKVVVHDCQTHEKDVFHNKTS